MRMRKEPVAWRYLRGNVHADLLRAHEADKQEELRREA
jgi:hypothetical protein